MSCATNHATYRPADKHITNKRRWREAISTNVSSPDSSASRTGPLSRYRVIDLSDERGIMAGYLLAQLGADVIHVEPPQGSGARRVPPFDERVGHEGESLFWEAFAAGAKSVVVDPSTQEGRERLRELAASADVLIESGALEADLTALRAANPRLVTVSISPFGPDGPKAGYAASDLTVWAAAGPLALTRDPASNTPLAMAIPQAFHQAAMDGACGALMALAARGDDGTGQHVEVSAQVSNMLSTLFGHLAASVNHENYAMSNAGLSKKDLDLSGSGARTQKTMWQVRDGTVEMHIGIGTAAGRFSNALFRWLGTLGECPEEFAAWDWITLPERIRAGELSMDDVERARAHVEPILARYSKNELVEIAERHGLMMAPILTVADLMESPQLLARDFFTRIAGDTLKLPAPFGGCGAKQESVRRAPRLGEHVDSIAPRPLVAAHAKPLRPLEGLKVLDLAWVIAGPLVGRSLADFGATVIRVESSKRVDTARILGPFPGGEFNPQTSAAFESCNLGKLGLSLDLSREEARETVRDLARWADVVVESFLPGQMEKFGLDYASLSAINPSLVMLSSSLTGQTGPTARLPGFGNIGAALSGMKPMVKAQGGLPMGPYGPYTDYIAPRFALLALLGALDERKRTGKGCHLDISQTETAVTMLGPQLLDYQVNGRVAEANGNRDARFAPSGVFRCAGEDRWIALTVRDNAEWALLAGLIGGAAGDARFAEVSGRMAHVDEVERLVEGWTSSRSQAEAEAELQAIGLPAHRIADTYDIAADPQIAHRGALLKVAHPIAGETVADASRFVLSETPAHHGRHAPRYGEDNDRVLAEVLRYPPERIEALRQSGALI
jgi:crotonobetainyl-CoA:carnitine CoA-transferase CaiB-like acyl-CoA transferase